VLSDGTRRIAIVALDLLGLDPDLVEAIRDGVEATVGVPREGLLLNCSHTHAGPATMVLRGLGERDPAYEAVLVCTVIGAVEMAADRLQPARLAYGSAAAPVGINRRQRLSDGRMTIGENPQGTYDPTVFVLRVDGAGPRCARCPRPLAVLFSHATHPVVLGNENTGISADLPGPAADVLTGARVGGAASVVPLFLQGCCGDINPCRRGSQEEIRSLGTMLGAAAVIGAESAVPMEALPLGAAREVLHLPQHCPSEAEARAQRDVEAERLREAEARPGATNPYALRTPRGMLAWAEDQLRAAQAGGEHTVPLELQCLRIGELAIVAMAGEAFIDLGRAVVARSPAPRTLALGYSNGLIGYLPTAAAFPLGGYEVDTAYKYFGTLMITAASEGLIVGAAERMLASLF
jgi:hypothetical protein